MPAIGGGGPAGSPSGQMYQNRRVDVGMDPLASLGPMPPVLVAADTVDRPDWIRRMDELHLLTPARIVVILLVAWLLTVLLGRVVQRVLRRTLGLVGRFDLGRSDPAEPQRAEARQQALGTAMRSAFIGAVWSIAVIAVVGELGVNIGAFVATATVVGGAVGFGAQTLVRDAIAGFFVLAEDQYGVGDDVDLGHATGTVERITLRSARVRDADGRIWHVPHGNVVRTANLSKAAQAGLTIEVARTSPLDEVEQVARQLCAELQADAVAAAQLTGEPRVVGLTEVRDDRLVLKLLAPTVPGQHETVRRAWRRLALAAFADGRLSAPAVAPALGTAAPATAPPPEPE